MAELISALVDRVDLSRATAGKALEALVSVVTDALKRGDEVRIAGLRTFGVAERGDRPGCNPRQDRFEGCRHADLGAPSSANSR